VTKPRKAVGQGHAVADDAPALPRRAGVQPARRGGRNIAAFSRFIPANGIVIYQQFYRQIHHQIHYQVQLTVNLMVNLTVELLVVTGGYHSNYVTVTIFFGRLRRGGEVARTSRAQRKKSWGAAPPPGLAADRLGSLRGVKHKAPTAAPTGRGTPQAGPPRLSA